MSKWREERMYEIFEDLNKNEELKKIYEMELIKSNARHPRTEFFDRMEKCYEKAKKKYENL